MPLPFYFSYRYSFNSSIISGSRRDSVLGHALQEERAEDRSRDDKKYAGAEPRRGGLLRVGVAGGELAVYLHASDKADDGTDRIDELRGRIEV